MGRGGGGLLGEAEPDLDLMGECPDWYICIQAAKYLGVPPWELVKQPLYWTEWALQSNSAEAQVEKEQHDRAESKVKAANRRRR